MTTLSNFGKQLVLLTLALLLVIGAAHPVFANDPQLARSSTLEVIRSRGVLLVGTDIPYTPFEFRDQQGRLVGFDIDVAQLIADEIGVDLEAVPTGFDVIIPALNTNKFDIIISGMTRTLKRALQVNFTDGYLTAGQIAMVNRRRMPNVTSYDQFNQAGVVITVQLGTTGEIAARNSFPNATIRTFDNAEVTVLEVVFGRADAVIFDDVFLLAELPKFSDRVYLFDTSDPLTKEILGLAIRKGDPDFLTWLNLFLEQIRTTMLVDEEFVEAFDVDSSFLGKPVHDALVHKWFVRFPEEAVGG
ncbi:MAG: transporter substrate-binding domain-containing protein [Candidatus Bipolaricaulia bacterium]